MTPKPRKAALNGSRNGHRAARSAPAAPADLEDAGRAAWQVVWTLPRVEDADLVMIEQLCRLQDEAAHLCCAIANDGMTIRKPVVSPRGEVLAETVVMHPALAMLRRIGGEAVEVAGELGLSPAGRRRLGFDVAADPPEPDELDLLRQKYARRRQAEKRPKGKAQK